MVPLINKKKRISPLLLILFLLISVCILILASVPPISRDALTHHLFIPKLWLINQSIVPIFNIPFSFYPMNLELLYVIPLYFGNDIFPKYIHFAFALLSSFLIFNYLRKLVNLSLAFFGSIFFLTIPIIVKLSITAYVDLGLLFFSTCSILLLLKWCRSNYKYKYLVLSSLFCGLAMGTKYNGLVLFCLLGLLTPILYSRTTKDTSNKSTKSLIFLFIFVFTALAAYSPWLLRNYQLTNNPIFPLHDATIQKLLNSNVDETNDLVKLSNVIQPDHKSNFFVNRKIMYGEKLWQTIFIPIRMFFIGQDDNPKYFDGKLSPFLLILPLFAFLLKPQKDPPINEKYFLLIFSVLFVSFTFFQSAIRIRYIVCIIPCLIILSIIGLQNIFDYLKSKINSNFCSLAIICLCGVILSYNLIYISRQFETIQPLEYLSGNITRNSYIKKFRPEYEVIHQANKTLSPEENVLCLFLGGRGYYMNFKPVFDMPYSKSSFINHLIEESIRNKNPLSYYLQHYSIRYIILRKDLVSKWASELTKDKQDVMTILFQNSSVLANENSYLLLQLRQQQ